MPLSILIRTLRRHWVSLLIWTGFCILVGIYNLALYPYFINLPEYGAYLMGLPQWIRFLEGQPGQLVGGESFLFLTTLGFTAPSVWLLLVIRIGLKETAGEEETGSLIFLLSHPIQRWSLYLVKMLAIIFMVALMALVLWGSLWAVNVFAKIPVGLDWLAAGILNLGLFVLWCSALAMLLGALTGKVDLSALITGLFILILWLVEGLNHLNNAALPVIHWFNPWRLVTMSMIEKNTITPWVWAVMVGLVVISFIGGMVFWQLRSFSRLPE
jgi:ABC-type transport system involved in multi-copper enzyme maturation permease subunit